MTSSHSSASRLSWGISLLMSEAVGQKPTNPNNANSFVFTTLNNADINDLKLEMQEGPEGLISIVSRNGSSGESLLVDDAGHPIRCASFKEAIDLLRPFCSRTRQISIQLNNKANP